MGKPAARVGDMHVCPMVTPGVPPVPHVGGPILPPGVPNVLIGGMPAAVIGAMATCTGPPDTVVLGSTGVLIGGRPAARMGDTCAHGGTIAVGCPNVLIGETMPGAPPVVAAMPPAVAPQQQPAPESTSTAQQQPAAQRSTAQSTQGAPSGTATRKPPSEQKTWVAFRMVDEAGKPVVGEKFRLKLPDGTLREGLTNMNGEVRVDGIDPGTCQLSFPDIDPDQWETR